ncbi:MAG: hypothetical protein LBQ35_00450, partial [Spirochaetaceae bacterium]|nr:hypothetical protein [Spirochaetaceae bacterium]
VLVEGETVLAEIGLSRETESASDYIGYMYFSKAVSVTGTGNGGDGGRYSDTYAVNAQAGWNRLHTHEVGQERTYKSDLSGIPADLKWLISPYSSWGAY